MTLISATYNDGSAVSPEQIDIDMPQLLAEHKKALKQDPTWEFFGGVITIDNRAYQVC